MQTSVRHDSPMTIGAWPGSGEDSAVIWEAFRPSTEPKRSIRKDEVDAKVAKKAARRSQTQTKAAPKAAQTKQPTSFAEDQGGIY